MKAYLGRRAAARMESPFEGATERPPISLLDKLVRLNWVLAALLAGPAVIGFLMLYSISGGSLDPWARPQIVRFAVGFGIMLAVAMVAPRTWYRLAFPIYGAALGLLVLVEFVGVAGMGAQRWLRLGPLTLQPSEIMKIAVVLALAAYFHGLEAGRRPTGRDLTIPLLMILTPMALVAIQPDLGTAILLAAGGVAVVFLAGPSLWWFAALATLGGGLIWAVFASQGTEWQLLKDYQYQRIETFFDPSVDPLGAGYHILQSTIAIGSGGLDGKGYMAGSQTQLRFLPETHTDFIFTTIAEEFGFRGGFGLLTLYMLITGATLMAASRAETVFGRLAAGGVAATFFLFFAVNIAMVTGLAPVVGVPLPLISYGGTSMLTLLFGFGVVLSVELHQGDPLLRG